AKDRQGLGRIARRRGLDRRVSGAAEGGEIGAEDHGAGAVRAQAGGARATVTGATAPGEGHRRGAESDGRVSLMHSFPPRGQQAVAGSPPRPPPIRQGAPPAAPREYPSPAEAQTSLIEREHAY